ncbi:PREDICTED: uncharacterized protein LOC106727851 isoform X2 [Myotis brandtii]|uniref:uncharacterized protein LOC106727851 isoform X2 n=1 Tax=Myotis brandtii TaxID=109478 RepID=UPI000703E8DD|nr:PREDICTED: uncharacterized protein LOC106727851 isoform X2 [Myotis brandtii]
MEHLPSPCADLAPPVCGPGPSPCADPAPLPVPTWPLPCADLAPLLCVTRGTWLCASQADHTESRGHRGFTRSMKATLRAQKPAPGSKCLDPGSATYNAVTWASQLCLCPHTETTLATVPPEKQISDYVGSLAAGAAACSLRGAAEQTAPTDTAPRMPRQLALSAQGSQRELSHLPGPYTPQGSGAVLLLYTWKLTHRPRYLPQDTGPPGGTASTGTRGQLTSKLVSSLTLPQTPNPGSPVPRGAPGPLSGAPEPSCSNHTLRPGSQDDVLLGPQPPSHVSPVQEPEGPAPSQTTRTSVAVGDTPTLWAPVSWGIE